MSRVEAGAWTRLPGNRIAPVLCLVCPKRQLKEDCAQDQPPIHIQEKQLWKRRQLKSHRLQNGGNLFVSLLHIQLGVRSDAHYVDRSPDSQRMLNRQNYLNALSFNQFCFSVLSVTEPREFSSLYFIVPIVLAVYLCTTTISVDYQY